MKNHSSHNKQNAKQSMKEVRFLITDMDCASCVAGIERDLMKLEGTHEVSVNFATGSAKVCYDENIIQADDILKKIKAMGYSVSYDEDQLGFQHTLFREGEHVHKMQHGHEDHSAHAATETSKQVMMRLLNFLLSLGLGVGVLVLGSIGDFPFKGVILIILSLLILVFPGREFFIKGIPSLLKGVPGMDTLVALGLGAGFIYSSVAVLALNQEGYFMDVAIISTFILLGRYLEALSKGKASEAIKKLLHLSAKTAHKIIGDDVVEISINDVKPGDKLLVKPGEKIPTDGKIIDGYASIDESMVTGESISVDKSEGANVIGATLNGNTSFKMVAEKVGTETLLAHIVKLVQDAQMSKAPIQKMVDKVSGYFVWGVIGVALLTLLLWVLVTRDFSHALVVMVSVLIIACPCALGLATPISIVVGSGKGASMGILLKKPEALEKMHKLTAICFDKTGTLTRGKPEVSVFKNLGGDEMGVLGRALSLELISEHPLAQSIITYIRTRGDVKDLEVRNFSAVPGRGISGEIGGQMYYLGNEKYMRDLNVDLAEVVSLMKDFQDQGNTLILFADKRNVKGIFGVKDKIKSNAREAISRLQLRNIRPIIITGDNERVATAIAHEAGINEIFAEVSPEDKVKVIENLKSERKVVGMIGDGINDSPALARADVGIAIGTGTDIAIESGDVVIVNGDLNKAVTAIELSEATLKNIKQNLFWAFIYNVIGIPLAAFGLLNPMISAAAMALSSVSVVLNALRLKRFKNS